MGCRTTAVLVWQEVEKMSKFQAGREPKQLTKEKRSPVLSVAVAKKALTDIKEIWIAFQMIGTRTNPRSLSQYIFPEKPMWPLLWQWNKCRFTYWIEFLVTSDFAPGGPVWSSSLDNITLLTRYSL